MNQSVTKSVWPQIGNEIYANLHEINRYLSSIIDTNKVSIPKVLVRRTMYKLYGFVWKEKYRYSPVSVVSLSVAVSQRATTCLISSASAVVAARVAVGIAYTVSFSSEIVVNTSSFPRLILPQLVFILLNLFRYHPCYGHHGQSCHLCSARQYSRHKILWVLTIGMSCLSRDHCPWWRSYLFVSGGKRDEHLILPLNDSVSLTLDCDQVNI